ncbi:hypothetical protein C5S53_02405, partial [Methanophagales archaeon]
AACALSQIYKLFRDVSKVFCENQRIAAYDGYKYYTLVSIYLYRKKQYEIKK